MVDAERFLGTLASHYKDTCDIHRETVKRRDRLFYGLLVVVGLFTFQLSSADLVSTTVAALLKKSSNVDLTNSAVVITTLLWFALLGWSLRYFQVALEIERQYEYIHAQEHDLQRLCPGSAAFRREGDSYGTAHSAFSWWAWGLYTILFPLLLIGSVGAHIVAEYCLRPPQINWMSDCVSAVVVIVSTILYLGHMHGSLLTRSGYKPKHKISS